MSPAKGSASSMPGALSITMLPSCPSAVTFTVLASSETVKSAQIRSTMHGTASIFVRSANCSFSTDEWSFSHAYSTGRLSSSVSGRFTRWSVSFSTAGPIAQEKDVAAAISGFSSSTSMVKHSMPRAPLATASAMTPTTPFSCATMSSSVMTYRPRPPHEHSPLIFTPTCCCVSFSLSMTGCHTALGRLRMTYGDSAFSSAGRTRPKPSRPAPKCT
mmetsp:Transcript_11939/g.49991  ORF Transcript_11939/g.49991 Transcript_11939/m.49991 type:complete len:216 (-) Transcript_11939:348-995(-)